MKNKKIGFKLGLALALIGVFFGAINHLLLEVFNFTLNILLGYPLFFCLGLSMVIFPGPEQTELKTQEDIKSFWKSTTIVHKLVWGLSFVGGIIVTVALIIYYNLK
jgi:hypothetical protein